ncbi:hypothetical protein V6N13_019760 [Hibiscus sabdariffa]
MALRFSLWVYPELTSLSAPLHTNLPCNQARNQQVERDRVASLVDSSPVIDSVGVEGSRCKDSAYPETDSATETSSAYPSSASAADSDDSPDSCIALDK